MILIQDLRSKNDKDAERISLRVLALNNKYRSYSLEEIAKLENVSVSFLHLSDCASLLHRNNSTVTITIDSRLSDEDKRLWLLIELAILKLGTSSIAMAA